MFDPRISCNQRVLCFGGPVEPLPRVVVGLDFSKIDPPMSPVMGLIYQHSERDIVEPLEHKGGTLSAEMLDFLDGLAE